MLPPEAPRRWCRRSRPPWNARRTTYRTPPGPCPWLSSPTAAVPL